MERLQLGPWRMDEPQLRRIMAAIGPTLVDLDLAPCAKPYARLFEGSMAPWNWRRDKVWGAAPEEHPYPNDEGLHVLAMAATLEREDGRAPLNLRSLSLARCASVTTYGFAQLVQACLHSLEHLDVSECVQLEAHFCEAFYDPIRPTNLRRLVLNGCSSLDDDGAEYVVQACPLLEVIQVCGCRKLTDGAARVFLDGCEKLVDLRMASCPRLSGSCFAAGEVKARNPKLVEGEVALLHIRSTLRVLDLGDCAALRRETCRWVATSCPNLVALRVASCAPLEDEGLLALAVQPTVDLISLDLSGCWRRWFGRRLDGGAGAMRLSGGAGLDKVGCERHARQR